MIAGGGRSQAERAESRKRKQRKRGEFARDAAGLGLGRYFFRGRFQFDWRFGPARDGAQTSMICGTISGRLPRTWLK